MKFKKCYRCGMCKKDLIKDYIKCSLGWSNNGKRYSSHLFKVKT